MAFMKMLLQNETLTPGQEKRLGPHLDVSKWDRLHFHFGSDARSIASLNVRVLFATPIPGTSCGAILADSTIWFEDTVSEREFAHTVPANFNGTGFVLSVPVVAPLLYDVILNNHGTADLTTLYVGLMAQEI
ncbi:MAG: hypothetical protein AB1646_04875 [Thermodesulfobacteriota bacterium]